MEVAALTVVASTEHFAHYLYGREFVAQIDQKALVNLMTSKTLNWRLQRFGMWRLSTEKEMQIRTQRASPGRNGQGISKTVLPFLGRQCHLSSMRRKRGSYLLLWLLQTTSSLHLKCPEDHLEKMPERMDLIFTATSRTLACHASPHL